MCNCTHSTARFFTTVMAFVKYVFVFTAATVNILEQGYNILGGIKHYNNAKIIQDVNNSYWCLNSAEMGNSEVSNM
jgi:hypothetical protein